MRCVPDRVVMSADDQGLGAFVFREWVMGKSLKWVGLAAALVCAGSAMAAGKTEAASSTIGANIDTAVDLSASPTLQRWQAGGTVVLGVREAAVPMSYAIGANEKFVGYHMDLCERVVHAIAPRPRSSTWC
jgi:glutamate/aspartate transport system substrate-binding protein